MAEDLPIFLGLNDKTDHRHSEDGREAALSDQRCAEGRQSGQMGREPRMPIPTGEHARDRVRRQDLCHRRLRQASRRRQFPLRSTTQGCEKLVAEGGIPASLQSRRRRRDRHQDLYFRRLRRAEPLPAFQVLRLRHGDRPMGADSPALAPARRDLGHRARRQDPSARRSRRALGRVARGLRSGDRQIFGSSPACAARPARSLSSASATTWASRWSMGKSTPSPAAWTPTTSTPSLNAVYDPKSDGWTFRAPLPTRASAARPASISTARSWCSAARRPARCSAPTKLYDPKTDTLGGLARRWPCRATACMARPAR